LRSPFPRAPETTRISTAAKLGYAWLFPYVHTRPESGVRGHLCKKNADPKHFNLARFFVFPFHANF
jgi:hypothetical protein